MFFEDILERNLETEANKRFDKHVKHKVDKVETEDKKAKKEGGGMSKLRNWFCDSDSEEISSEEEEGAGENEWEAVKRKDKNVKRKERWKQRKDRFKAETAVKVSKIVGVGPVKRVSVNHFEKEHKDFEKAKMATVKKFLQIYLNYEEDILKIRDQSDSNGQVQYHVHCQ